MPTRLRRTDPPGALTVADGLAREIGYLSVEVSVGPGREHGLEALLEFVGAQPTLGGGVSQLLGNLLAVRVRCPQGRSP